MIGLIGVEGHALRHRKFLKELGQEVVLYHPRTHPDFDSILRCDGIIIASPTRTHLDYVRRLSGYEGKVYLEKPGFASLEEADEVENCGLNLMIGYHYPHSILKEVASLIIGERIQSFDVILSKGIAYKKDFSRGDKGAVSHYGLGHIISIYALFGGDLSNIKTELYYNEENGVYDTAVAVGPRFKGTFTWGGPLLDPSISIVTTNSIVNVTPSEATIQTPRDTFDSRGWFVEPPVLYRKKMNGIDIKPCLKYFLNTDVFSKQDLKQAVDISRLTYYNL